MKAAKLRDMTMDELKLEESKLIEQIFRQRFQVAAGQAVNPARVHLLRKDLARVKTILGQRTREGVSGPASAAAKPPPAIAVTGETAPPAAARKGKRESVAAGGGTGRTKGAAKTSGAKQERG